MTSDDCSTCTVSFYFLFISTDEIEKVTDESDRSLFSEKKPELQETMVWYGIMYDVIVIITW